MQSASWRMAIKERNDLAPFGADDRELKCDGSDPYVVFDLPRARSGGPYFEVSIVDSTNFPGLVRVYVDSGSGFSEEAASNVSVHRIGSNCVIFLQLQDDAQRIRLHPYATLGQVLTISTLELRPFRHRRNLVARIAFAARLMRSRGRTSGQIYGAARRVFRNEGLSGILQRLHPASLYPPNQSSQSSVEHGASGVSVPKLTQEWSIPQFYDLAVSDDPFSVFRSPSTLSRTRQSISVLVRTQFNRPNLLKRAIESVARQDESPANLSVTVFILSSAEFKTSSKAICDDLLATYRGDDIDLQFIFSKSPHRSALLNQGLDAAKETDFVCILDDDDFLFPSHFSRHLAKHATSNLTATYSASDVLYVDGPGDTSEEANSGIVLYAAWWSYAKLLRFNLFPIQAVFFRPKRDIRFSTDLDALEDWDFWLRLLKQGNIAGICERTSAFRMPRPGTKFAAERIKHHLKYEDAFWSIQKHSIDPQLSPEELSTLVAMTGALK